MLPNAFGKLPLDILIQIVRYLDEKSQLELGLTSKKISSICCKQLWHTRTCTSISALEAWANTLNKEDNVHPYHEWVIGLNLAFDSIQFVPDSILIPRQITTRTLKLLNVHATPTASRSVMRLISCEKTEEVEINKCSVEIIAGFATRLEFNRNKHLKLNRISIIDCFLLDTQVAHIVSFTPNLRSFTSEGCSYLSDTAILAITEHCPLIETMIVTLPNHIRQSNTITVSSLKALSKCKKLTKLICKGQVRLIGDEHRIWLLKNCPSLEYCDLSYD
ncbi:hypothetical protein [Parasitella parasitica]|uniref:F-box domain-containing protein n=1 Tax=Parasitella parasitica TaxID=35722 RepID=A0A0B7NF45_9FUNG|nr:hypothetical protein [Parasitella parasitica]